MTLTEKDKMQLFVVCGLVLVFAFAAKSSFSRVKKSQDRFKRARLVQAFAQTGAVSPVTTQAGVSDAQAGGTSGIDPFSGRQITIGIEEQGNASSFRLSGIVYNKADSKNSYAIINNNVVRVGETVSGSQFKLTEISEQDATLSDGKSTLTLKTW